MTRRELGARKEYFIRSDPHAYGNAVGGETGDDHCVPPKTKTAPKGPLRRVGVFRR